MILLHSYLRPWFNMARPRLAAHLPNQFADLQKAGRADRMTSRTEPAARIDGDPAVKRRHPLVDEAGAFPRRTEAEPLVEHELGRRHRVVQFDGVEVLRAD